MEEQDKTNDRLSELVARHPTLFRGREPRCGGWLPGGWFAIADALCTDLAAQLGERAVDFEVDQVKEEFGGLRFYFALARLASDPPPSSPALDADPDAPQPPPGVDLALVRSLRARVQEAESASEQACCFCGGPAVKYVDGGFVFTACQEHSGGCPTEGEARAMLEAKRAGKAKKASGDG
jgi:hypothetical protein